MKHTILVFLIALTASAFSNAQTLQVDPLYAGGATTFKVQNGAPGATVVIGYSLTGSGPFTSGNGITLDLSLPIGRLNPFTLDAAGNGTQGPLPLPSSALAGLQVWFQGVQWVNPNYAVTNMVPMTVDAPPLADMVAIPAGTFEMGDHWGGGFPDERPVHSVTLDSFFMDKYEVSNAKFADYLNNSAVTVSGLDVYQVAGAFPKRICLLADGLNYNNGITFSIDAGKDNHPVVYQTWYGAALYCNYLSTLEGRTPCYDETTFDCDFTADGFRLPTEAEWEYASRGGEHNPYYQYPWGSDTITSSDANYGYYVLEVGGYAANGYGLYDMAGNVWEWCNDWYDIDYYSSSPLTNPTGPTTTVNGSDRSVRGGASYGSDFLLRCAYRTYADPMLVNSSNLGFRVVTAQ